MTNAQCNVPHPLLQTPSIYKQLSFLIFQGWHRLLFIKCALRGAQFHKGNYKGDYIYIQYVEILWMIAKSPVGNYWDSYETLVILQNYFIGEIAHLTGAGYRRHAQYVLPPHPAVSPLPVIHGYTMVILWLCLWDYHSISIGFKRTYNW